MKKNPALYEIHTYLWLYELSLKSGARINIGNVPSAEWDRLKRRGFGYVWLMGVWKRSRAGFEIFRTEAPEYKSFTSDIDSVLPDWEDKDLVGSPFSVAGYEPDPAIGTWEDLERARDELHKRDMGLILDFVPNHTAPDHPWVINHPEYYFRARREDFEKHPGVYSRLQHGDTIIHIARGRDPHFAPWTDTVQLNYFHPETRRALTDELKRIAEHCDGFRCDMAMLVLNEVFLNTWGWIRKDPSQPIPEEEFWTEARKAVPGILLMAEAYWDTEWALQQSGFDYVYDKKLYDRIVSFSPGDIYLHLKAEMSFQKGLVRFLENHDEKRSIEVFGKQRLEAAAVLFSTLPGIRLYYQGQIEGNRIKIPVQLRRIMREKTDREVEVFYERLLSIINHDIFHNGQWRLREVYPMNDGSCGNLIAYTWALDRQIKLIVVNMSPSVSQGRIPLIELVSSDDEYVLTDEMHGISYIRNGADMENPGLIVILNSFKSHIFNISLSDNPDTDH